MCGQIASAAWLSYQLRERDEHGAHQHHRPPRQARRMPGARRGLLWRAVAQTSRLRPPGDVPHRDRLGE